MAHEFFDALPIHSFEVSLLYFDVEDVTKDGNLETRFRMG
jgi:hypothetical protein